MKPKAKFLTSALVTLASASAAFGFQSVLLPGVSLYNLGVHAALAKAVRRTSAAPNLNPGSGKTVPVPVSPQTAQTNLRLQFGDLSLIGGIDRSNNGLLQGPLDLPADSSAWRAAIAWERSNWGANVGFQQIDPLYSLDPYRMDPSILPANSQGPAASIHFNIGETLNISAGGEWLNGLGRQFSLSSPGSAPAYSLRPDDRIALYSAELAYRPIGNIGLSFGMQAIDWNLRGHSDFSLDSLRNSEKWYSFGLGYNLSSSASLRFLWQVSDYGQSGFSPFASQSSKAPTNLIRTQLTIKF